MASTVARLLTDPFAEVRRKPSGRIDWDDFLDHIGPATRSWRWYPAVMRLWWPFAFAGPILIVGGFWQQVFFADSLGWHLFELGVSAAGVVLTYLAAATVAPAVGYVQREEDRAKEQPT